MPSDPARSIDPSPLDDIVSDARLDVAREAARAGGRVLVDAFRSGIEFREKGESDLVSEADVGSERAIVAVIRDAFPGHAVLAEETHKDEVDAEHLWIVDPLDGTTNFAHGLDHVAISIAYCARGVVECGVVHNPIRGDWYLAVRGQGAWHDGVPARVSAQDRLHGALVGLGFYYDRGAMMEATLESLRDLFAQRIHGMRRLGTAALDLCLVGLGVFDAFFEYKLAPWDFAAGRLFVEEAGGRVTTCRGGPLPIATTTLLASNGALHDAMLEIVASRAPQP